MSSSKLSLSRLLGSESPVHRYRFPPQETSLGYGDVVRDPRADLAADKIGKIAAIDPIGGTVDIKKLGEAVERHPTAIHEYDRVDPAVLAGSLHELARWIAERGIDSTAPNHRAARDLLLRLRPRTRTLAAGPLLACGEEPLDGALSHRSRHGRRRPAIQGPPGAGKTYIGAQMTVALVREGKRVGVTATSHKVVRGFLEKTLKEARKSGATLLATHKPSAKTPRTGSLPDGLSEAGTNPDAVAALDNGHVVGGVAWLWASTEADGQLDYLLIDEAGQMSLAQVLACSRSARNLILLGDPQQLQQPQRGAHPEGAEVSALDHMLRGGHTIAPEQGLFLGETWRLPPPICAFTSELFYDGRLTIGPTASARSSGAPHSSQVLASSSFRLRTSATRVPRLRKSRWYCASCAPFSSPASPGPTTRIVRAQ